MKQVPDKSILKSGARAALILLCLATLSSCKPEEIREKVAGTDADGKPVAARTAEVQSGDFVVSISATGKVVANREMDILSKAGGEIIELPFRAGDHVKKGDLLALIDPINEERNVQKTEAALDMSKARLAKARNDLEIVRSSSRKSVTDAEATVKYAETKLSEAEAKYKRQDELFAKNLVPKENVETALTILEQARNELSRAQSTLEDVKSLPFQIAAKEQDVKLAEVDVKNSQITLAEAQKRLTDTKIIAPMDGVLTERKPEVGMVISSPLGNVGGGTKLMALSDLSALYLVTAVDETDIGGIKENQRAIITSDAYPAQQFTGTVAHIAPAGIATNNVVTFDVKVKVEGDGLNKLRPGMTADVTIVINESKNTLWVQSEAIQESPEGTFVEIENKEGSPQKITVTAGLTDGLMTEIKGGIKAGQKLIVREDETLSAWERGEGGERPMRGGFNPFKKSKAKPKGKG
ncbi:efflux RND transporter periplasmic adaptor subunit [Candidatus Sumerlaeota bacterium]|nr:efflux RND transporter periplasmic adaptor subunit [Candidatus Sumerlaeota bacterium]MBI3736839.1 efflux RND transporter periplasmic adaptor subunit [Candidatus Sumerlaeota bacterium]